jgi:hypothetical protein
VLQLGLLDPHVLAHGRVGPDVGVRHGGARADDGGAAHRGALEPHPLLDHHAALHPGVHELAVDPLGEVVEDQPVGLEHVVHLPGVLPPAVDDVRVHPLPRVHEVLDGVGDLELVAPGRLDGAGGVEDRRGEHVDAHEREVGGRLLRLLHEPGHAAVAQLGHAVVLGVRHRREQDEGVGLLGAEGLDERGDAVAEQVVPEVHHERRAR